LQSDGAGNERLRLKVAVAARQFHATQLRDLTGLDVGEGQATILLGDMRAYQGRLQQETNTCISDEVAAGRWTNEVLRPGMERAHQAVGRLGHAIQAYCDLLEVRFLLSEQAKLDVGDTVALEALALRSVPPESAARLAIVEAATSQLPMLTPELIDRLAGDAADVLPE
jgi:hypothetical protein